MKMKLIRQVKIKMPKTDELKGSLSLEAALSLPPFILLAAFLLSLILSVQSEIMMRHALDLASREVAMILPIAEAAGKGLEIDPESQAKLDELSSGEKSGLINECKNLALSAATSNIIQTRCDKHMAAIEKSLKAKHPRGERKLLLERSSDGCSYKATMFFEVFTVFGKAEKKARAIIPVWNRDVGDDSASAANNTEADQEEKESIWLEHNFKRGKHFREKYGANLPDTAEIAYLKNGEAARIRSIDLGLKGYSDISLALAEIDFEIEKLRTYRGGKVRGISEEVVIKESAIKRRKMVIVIPEDIEEARKAAFKRGVASLAAKASVDFEIFEDGKSAASFKKQVK